MGNLIEVSVDFSDGHVEVVTLDVLPEDVTIELLQKRYNKPHVVTDFEIESGAMRKCTSCNWEFDGTGTKCPDCRINNGDVLDITPFQAHSLIKACEAIIENTSDGRYTHEEIEECRSLIPHLRHIAGQTVDPT